MDLLKKIVEVPLKLIVSNAGLEGAVIVNKVKKNVNEEIRNHKDFNVKNMSFIRKTMPSSYHRILISKEKFKEESIDQLVKPLETSYKEIEEKDNDAFIKHELKLIWCPWQMYYL